jgi:hypothetical protein
MGNYVPVAMKLMHDAKAWIGLRLSHIMIYHDPNCGVNSDRDCNCDPDVSIHLDGCPAVQHKRCNCGTIYNNRINPNLN